MSDREVKYPPSDVAGVAGQPFRKALSWAAKQHDGQHRKGKPEVPYVSHLLGVASLVLEAGGTETEAVAALLHDVIEDTKVPDDEIRRRFGPRVVQIVRACTDDLVAPGDDPEQPDGPPTTPRGAGDWHERKSVYLEKLRHEEDASILLVSGADKLHNARAMVADLRAEAPAWTPFNAPPLDQLWYYTSLRDMLCERLPRHLGAELRAAVDDIVALTNLEVETAGWREAHPEAGPYDD